eukprot:gnl/MRDRNA2_/MRDRNA2_18753_c0_seq1.p1 gnl/MRDRNA2_/MRDRNA2_18753_c0~~gnl/MRDRNA2_/MRDRNA2_18753_c0_seq1.p1  ORF type:complete len:419 (-),score=48.53 gnl/MRDRNA2_/MRDRNA2_18753_c0_seq1:97-1353(-)
MRLAKIIIACLLADTGLVVGLVEHFVEAAKVPTRGAAGWTHFQIGGKDYLAVANFFTSGPGKNPSMKTRSAVFEVQNTCKNESRPYCKYKLQLTQVQSFETKGAHGIAHFEHNDQHYIAVPNYYGEDAIVLRFDQVKKKFVVFQNMKCDGGGAVEAFKLPNSESSQMLAFPEFNIGIVSIYILKGEHPNEQFEMWQQIKCPGVGAVDMLTVESSKDKDGQILLFASSYVTRATGWRTTSQVFALNENKIKFEKYDSDVETVGAHDVEVTSINGRHFAFYSNDKNEQTTIQQSELFEWVGTYPNAKLVSRQKVQTDGAHAAEFFSHGNKHFLAVANLGDRQKNTYRRDSVIYQFDPQNENEMLKLVQKVPTLGATDFLGFSISGVTFLAVSNEQDEELGGDVNSFIWALREGEEASGEL